MENGRVKAQEKWGEKHPLVMAYQNAWLKLQKYYALTDDAHSIYGAAILLHPGYRKRYFDVHWVGDEAIWKDIMIRNIKKTWEDEYRPQTTTPSLSQSHPRAPTIIERYLHRTQLPQSEFDSAFDNYIQSPQIHFSNNDDVIPWVLSQSNMDSGLKQQILDLLSIPAMSTELERVFSQAKLTLTPQRNRLTDQTIELLELLRYWWVNNIITQQRGVSQPRKRRRKLLLGGGGDGDIGATARS